MIVTLTRIVSVVFWYPINFLRRRTIVFKANQERHSLQRSGPQSAFFPQRRHFTELAAIAAGLAMLAILAPNTVG